MNGGCYVCGSAELAPGADPRNPLCAGCLPVREHVVSNTRAAGNVNAAACRCGWTYTGRVSATEWPISAALDREEAVRGHWREILEAAE